MDPVRVLFVDDEADLVSAVVERMRLRGIEASGVTSGGDALKMVEDNGFEVLVLDVRMPGVGGLDVIRRIKQRYPHIEVVLLSGHGSAEDVEKGLSLGAFDYLQKPVDIARLIDIVRRAAAAHREARRPLTTINTLSGDALEFIGRLVAGQCHDVVNALNVINELAGLQRDVAVGAGNGPGAGLPRLAEIAVRIQSQVERAGGMARDLNRFAHGADSCVFDVGEVLSLLVSLAARTARLKRGQLVWQSPPPGATMQASPLLLQCAVFACIEAALAGEHGDEREVSIACRLEKEGAEIEIATAGPFEEAQLATALGLLKRALPELGGRLKEAPDPARGRFVFVVPVVRRETG